MKMSRRNKIAMATVVAVMGVVGAAKFALPGPRPDGPPQKDMTIDAAVRAQVVEQATAELEKRYVFPDVAATLDRQLHEQLRHGDFDGDSSAQRFAEALTQALRRDTRDGHLEVVYFEHPVPVRADDDKPSPQEEKEELLQNLRLNYGLAEVKRLQGDIGYIDVHAFGRLPGAADRIAAAMAFLADTNALIIDLRRCGGGDPDTVMAFASYLFDKPTHLNDIWFRDDNKLYPRWTTATVPGKRYGQSRPVYVLTSQDTFSGGEDFAYALKNEHRAILVGETTGGGAHPGSPHRIGEHFMMFVPSGRPISPVTHTDWEGVGVAPDIRTSADKALDVAQVRVLEQLIAAEADPDWRQRLQDRLAEVR